MTMTTFETRPSAVHDQLGADTMQGKATLAGWYEDPQERHRMRYFSGTEWTQHVTHFGPTPCTGCHQA